MLAFWTGGACANITTTPTPEQPGIGGSIRIPPDFRRALRMKIIHEDDLLLLIVASQFSKRLH